MYNSFCALLCLVYLLQQHCYFAIVGNCYYSYSLNQIGDFLPVEIQLEIRSTEQSAFKR